MRAPCAKLFETMILTLRGTPFLFEGDELGMTDFPFKKLSDYDDIAVKNAWKDLVESGKITPEAFLTSQAKVSRDNARTPMQWNASSNAGFTTASAHPWLAVNPNYTAINAQAEAADPNSVLNFDRDLIALRARTPAFVYGDYQDLDPQHLHVYAYTRTLTPQQASGRAPGQYLVVLNFTSAPQTYTLPNTLKAGTLALANLPQRTEAAGSGAETSILHLRPWEARIYKQP